MTSSILAGARLLVIARAEAAAPVRQACHAVAAALIGCAAAGIVWYSDWQELADACEGGRPAQIDSTTGGHWAAARLPPGFGTGTRLRGPEGFPAGGGGWLSGRRGEGERLCPDDVRSPVPQAGDEEVAAPVNSLAIRH
jgi:hypothetical protein